MSKQKYYLIWYNQLQRKENPHEKSLGRNRKIFRRSEKSTLINHILGTDQLETGDLRNDDKGRHTTTHRELFMIPGKGMVVDTPGMRELGMWSAEDGIDHTFSDIEEFTRQCRFSDCSHGNEPGCALRQAVKDGLIAEERYRSYMKLKAENAYNENTEEYLTAKKRKFKEIAKLNKQIINNK